MKTSPARFSPDQDTYLTSFHRPDAEGRAVEIEEELFHSQTRGFYIRTHIQQIRKGRTWETAELFECDEAAAAIMAGETWKTPAGQFRVLETFRPLTREETVRKILENEMPEEDGLRTSVLAALFSPTGKARF